MKAQRLSILHFHKMFPDNESCLVHLFNQFYANAKCPKCGKAGRYHLQKGTSHFVCACGGHQISPKAGTIFEKSDTDLVKWYFAIFLMSQSRNGVAAKELERACDVTYKTAWRMAKQIRLLMQEDPELLWGDVEVDDTYIGGKRRGKRGRGAEGKTIVFGKVQRKGKVNACVVENLKADTLQPHFTDHVAKGTRLMSDELQSYKKIAGLLNIEHEAVSHGKKEYVRGDVHTNTIEGFWSQMKRSMDGTHHVISPKYLPLYVSEFQWRYNHGRNPVSHLFDLLLSRVALQHVGVVRRIGLCP